MAIRGFIGSRRWACFGLKVPGDQARAFVERKICPRPLEKHCEPVAKADQKNVVHKQANQPSREPAQMHKIQVCDSFVPSNGCHGAFVPIVEALRIVPVNHSEYIELSVTTWLHG